MSANHSLLKKLGTLRDKLELRRDDVAVGEAALEDESRELESRRDQLQTVRSQIDDSVREMDNLGRADRAEKAKREEWAHEEPILRSMFWTILDQGVQDLQADRRQRVREAEEAGKIDTELREVSVLFEDEEAVFRVTDVSYNFDELCSDTCRFFDVHPIDMWLVDEQDEPWPGNASVRQMMSQYDNAYGKINLKFRVSDEEEEVIDADDADNILQLLMGADEDQDDDEEGEEEEEERRLALEQQMASAANGADPDAMVDAAAAGASLASVGAERSKKKKKKLDRKKLFNELPGYCTYLLLFLYGLQTRRVVEWGYQQLNAIRTALVDENFGDYNEKAFADVANFEEVFDWMENVFVPGVYPDEKYNGDPFAPREVGTVMTYNRVVGAIRMRTVRTRPNINCAGKDAALNKQLVMNSTGDIYHRMFIPDCHGEFSEENEETRPYGPAVELVAQGGGSCEGIAAPPPPPDPMLDMYGVPPTADELDSMTVRKLCRAFTYTNASVTKERPFAGKAGVYTGGGYVRDINNPADCRQRPSTDPSPNPDGVCERGDSAREDINLAIQQLKEGRWMDEATRAVIITVTFYNANLNFFGVLTFMFEFTRAGLIYPKTDIKIASQEMFADLTLTIIEFITYGFLAWYTFVQVRLAFRSVRHTGSIAEYASDVWNMLEMTVLFAFYISIYLRITLAANLHPDPVIFEEKFYDYGTIGMLYAETFNFDSLCVIALFFKMLKYAQLNIKMNMLWGVLTRSAQDLMYFSVMLLILLLGFAMMSLQFFGTTIEGYSTIFEAVVELLLVLLGQYDLEPMQQSQPFLGVIFFFIYIVLVFLIMMNIFLAILGEAYTVIRAESDEAMKSQIKTKSRGFLGWLKYLRAYMRAKVAQRRMKKAKGAAGGGAATDSLVPVA